MESFRDALNNARGSDPGIISRPRKRTRASIDDLVRPFFSMPGDTIEAIGEMWHPTDKVEVAIKMGRRIGLSTLNLEVVSNDRELGLVERTASAVFHMWLGAVDIDHLSEE